MRNFVFAITIASMAFSSVAMANPPTSSDNVGLYFDAKAKYVCVDDLLATGPSTYHVYLIFTELSNDWVGGFELNVAMEGPLLLLNLAFAEGSAAINLLQPPGFMVGFGNPIQVVRGKAIVAEFDIFVVNPIPPAFDENGDAFVYIRDIFYRSLEEPLPAYLDENYVPHALYQSTGTEDDPVMIFSLPNCACDRVVATDETTWDQLKSLYR